MNTSGNQWRSIFSYYKWHIIFFILIIICIVFVTFSFTTSYESDLVIGFIGTTYVHEQSFEDNQSDINKLLNDANNDGSKYSTFSVNRANKQKEVDNLLDQAIEADAYHIYITTKEAFLNRKDKKPFATLSKPSENVDTLKDSQGRIYAVSLDNNTYVSSILGIRDPKDMYIAVASSGKKDYTDFEKNAINIANYIVESRKNYN